MDVWSPSYNHFSRVKVNKVNVNKVNVNKGSVCTRRPLLHRLHSTSSLALRADEILKQAKAIRLAVRADGSMNPENTREEKLVRAACLRRPVGIYLIVTDVALGVQIEATEGEEDTDDRTDDVTGGRYGHYAQPRRTRQTEERIHGSTDEHTNTKTKTIILLST